MRRLHHKRWLQTPQGRVDNARRTREYNRLHPDHVRYNNIRKRSREEGMPFVLTREEFSKWFLSRNQSCEYCGVVDLLLAGIPSCGSPMIAFSIDRKNPDLPYTIDNMAACCWNCNRLKSDFFTYEEWKDIADKYVRPKWEAKVRAALGKPE